MPTNRHDFSQLPHAVSSVLVERQSPPKETRTDNDNETAPQTCKELNRKTCIREFMKTSLRNLYILPALTAGLGLLLALPAVVQAQISYQTLDDPLAVYLTYANGISGDKIVGWYRDSSGGYHGFLYNGSEYTTLDDPNAVTQTRGGYGGTFVNGISGTNI